MTRALGVLEEVEVDSFHFIPKIGDRYLLCSDGQYNPLEPADIQRMLQQGTPEEACESLVNLANERGGPDNITAIVVEASPCA